MQKKQKGRSRLKAYKRKIFLDKFTAWSLLPVLFLWIAVFCSFEGVSKIAPEAQAYTNDILILDTRDTNISSLIEDSVNEFLPSHKSESLMIMHCLAHRESGHGASDGHGDGGLAGGPYQFHEATWQRMRKQMIKQGAATEIGSRYNLKQAIMTTAWAISQGRALEWGPILRDSKGSDFASCQKPSWYK